MNIQSGRVNRGIATNRMQMAAHAMNRKSMREIKSGKRKDDQEQRKDRVQLSSKNWMQDHLENLMERKQELIEKKTALMASTDDWDSIKAAVALYEEQISNVETEISRTMKQMVEEQLQKAEEEKKDGKEPETKEEQQMQYLNDLSNTSMDYKQASQVHKAYDQKKRDASVMSMEIKLDDSRGATSQGKRERLGEVLAEADQLYAKAMRGYAYLNRSLDEMEEENVEEQKDLSDVEQREQEAVSALKAQEQDASEDEEQETVE